MIQPNDNDPIIPFLGWFAILAVLGTVIITAIGMKADLIANLAGTAAGALGGACMASRRRSGDGGSK